MTIHGLAASAEALRGAATGAPALLVLDGITGLEALALPAGVAVWQLTPPTEGVGGPARLHRPGTDPATATLPLPALPAGALALLVPEAARAAGLLGPILGPTLGTAALPPLVEAPGGVAEAALPALARLALGALGGRLAETARLQRALVTLREEAEETRAAMASLIQGVGHVPPPPPILALAAEPAAAAPATVALAAGEAAVPALAQRLGTTLEGVAAVAICLAEAALADPGAVALRVRLSGAESGRVRGAWTIPGAALAPGWLVLDLPSPLGPLRETACLDLAVEGLAPGDRLAVALEDRVAPADRAVAGAEGAPAAPGRALAFRLWIAPFGRRFVLSPHWDWEGQDRPLGLPVRLPEPCWAAARGVAGAAGLVAVGEAGPIRPVLALPPGGQALVLLPAVPVAGLDLLEAEVAVRLGDAAGLEAALWTQPEGQPIAQEADLSFTAGPGARGSGWRAVDAARGGLTLGLRLPPGGPPVLAVALALRKPAGPDPSAPAVRVEWAEVLGRALAPALPPPAEGAARQGGRSRLPPSPALAAIAPADAVPSVAAVRLQELYAMEGGGYRHLDIGIEGLRLGALVWPRARFKFAVNGEAPQIEVRARPDWPVIFERWPGEQADEHGPFFVLTEADRGGRAQERMWSERDRRLLNALLRLLPTVVATAARAATADPAEYDAWVATARRFAAALLGE